MGLSITEILLIVLAVVLLFGAKRIPELARALGKASYEYKKAKNQLEQESKDFLDQAERHAAAEAQNKNVAQPSASPVSDPEKKA